MFAPEGYIRLTDLVPELHDWANRILLAYDLENEGEDPSSAFDYHTEADAVRISLAFKKLNLLYPDANDRAQHERKIIEFRKSRREQEFTSSLVAYLHLSETLLLFDTLVCSPSGQTMRAPTPLLLHIDRLDWCYLSMPPRKVPEFRNFFEMFDKGLFDGEGLADRFCFIDSWMGIVRLKNNSLTSMVGASHLNLTSDDAEDFYRHGVKPFLGHSIVWSPKNFPEEVVELLDFFRALKPEWKAAELYGTKNSKKLATRRRGPKPTGAKDEYYRRYPTGKPSDISFEAIAAELAEAGFPISARQIQNYERMRTII